MPAKAAWTHRISEIVAILEQYDFPVLDRAGIESLFGVSRRGAVNVMNRFGACQAGKSLVIDRTVLIQCLRGVATNEDAVRETARRRRIGNALADMQKYRSGAAVRIRVEPEVFSAKLAGLPADVALKPGDLHIRYCTAEDLLKKLFELSQAIANDYEQFECMTHVNA